MRPKDHHLKVVGDTESMVIMVNIMIGGIQATIDHLLLLEVLLRITGADHSNLPRTMVVLGAQGSLNEAYLF
jgi:hypothetical protein